MVVADKLRLILSKRPVGARVEGRTAVGPRLGALTKMKARVHITLKSGVLDPQGKAIGHALASLGFAGVNDVRQGKVIELDLSETDRSRAEAAVKSMCEKLLANTVIENYSIEIKG